MGAADPGVADQGVYRAEAGAFIRIGKPAHGIQRRRVQLHPQNVRVSRFRLNSRGGPLRFGAVPAGEDHPESGVGGNLPCGLKPKAGAAPGDDNCFQCGLFHMDTPFNRL